MTSALTHSATPATLPAGQVAVGPGTVVLGMHRSGTSLVTTILRRLGGRLCQEADLLRGREYGQPVDYGESRSIVLFNESLLRAFGGDWAAPPGCGPAGGRHRGRAGWPGPRLACSRGRIPGRAGCARIPGSA